jgi:hypothetical protein
MGVVHSLTFTVAHFVRVTARLISSFKRKSAIRAGHLRGKGTPALHCSFTLQPSHSISKRFPQVMENVAINGSAVAGGARTFFSCGPQADARESGKQRKKTLMSGTSSYWHCKLDQLRAMTTACNLRSWRPPYPVPATGPMSFGETHQLDTCTSG